MKQKLIALIGSLLTACMALSWWVGCGIVSAFLLGEYAYPEDNN